MGNQTQGSRRRSFVGLGLDRAGSSPRSSPEAGLKVVALEGGGAMRSPRQRTISLPSIRDELRYVARHDLMQNNRARYHHGAQQHPSQEALPMRAARLLPARARWWAESAVHWSGHTWRWTRHWSSRCARCTRSATARAYIPDDMTIQDWGITLCGARALLRTSSNTPRRSPARPATCGGRDPSPAAIRFEAPRGARIPAGPPLTTIPGEPDVQRGGPATTAIIRFPAGLPPTRRAPIPIPDGLEIRRPCQYCGYFASASAARRMPKARPHLTVIPIANCATPQFRAGAPNSLGHQGAQGFRTASASTGVTLHQRAQRRGIRAAPPAWCCWCAYGDQTTCTSCCCPGFGEALRPRSPRKGVIGKNYCYPDRRRKRRCSFEGRRFNPFMSAGRLQPHHRRFQHQLEFRPRAARFSWAAYNVAGGFNTALPIRLSPGCRRGTPRLGQGMEGRDRPKWYQTAMNISARRQRSWRTATTTYDLDPTYRNAFGAALDGA